MSEKINNGGPAFPVCTEMNLIPVYNSDGIVAGNKSHVTNIDGMSLRDYFAAKAMQCIIVGIEMWPKDKYEEFAKQSYLFADAMLAEREK